MVDAGDDAGKGETTFVTDNGKSLIDYVLVSHNLFPIVSNFVVHDFFFLFSSCTNPS